MWKYLVVYYQVLVPVLTQVFHYCITLVLLHIYMEEITRFRSDIPRRTCHCTPCASCTNGKLLSRSGDDLISDFIDLFSIGDTASS